MSRKNTHKPRPSTRQSPARRRVYVELPEDIYTQLAATAAEWHKSLSKYIRDEIVRAVKLNEVGHNPSQLLVKIPQEPRV